MTSVLANVNGQVLKVADASQVEAQCRENFNLRSDCLAAVVFNDVDISGQVLVSVASKFTQKCLIRCRITLFGETLGLLRWTWIIMEMTMSSNDISPSNGPLIV